MTTLTRHNDYRADKPIKNANDIISVVYFTASILTKGQTKAKIVCPTNELGIGLTVFFSQVISRNGVWVVKVMIKNSICPKFKIIFPNETLAHLCKHKTLNRFEARIDKYIQGLINASTNNSKPTGAGNCPH
jgi:hypothetical protein